MCGVHFDAKLLRFSTEPKLNLKFAMDIDIHASLPGPGDRVDRALSPHECSIHSTGA